MGEKTKNDFASQIGDEAVISVAEMRAADARTIAGGTPGKVLMGRAAQGIFDAVAKGDIPGFENGWNGKKTVIICYSVIGFVFYLICKCAFFNRYNRIVISIIIN